MRINKISLHNVRSYTDGVLVASSGINIICGANAVGKTNLLESIYFSAIGRSPRTTQDKELVRWGSDLASVSIELSDAYRSHNISVFINSKGEKKILIDKLPISKLSELLGTLNVVYFSPDEMKLVKDSPKERRRFIDIALSTFYKTYLNTLSTYNRVLLQRNTLLKEGNPNKIAETLDIYDGMLAKEGFVIQQERERFMRRIYEVAKEIHSKMTNGKEELIIEYEKENANSEDELLKLYTDSREKDVGLRYTTVGIHRDDFAIKANGIDLRKFGSQGQQRTASLSLILALIRLNEEVFKETPILLLDDVLSELDENRREMLLANAEHTQTFITATEWKEDFKPKNAVFFEITKGGIIKKHD